MRSTAVALALLAALAAGCGGDEAEEASTADNGCDAYCAAFDRCGALAPLDCESKCATADDWQACGACLRDNDDACFTDAACEDTCHWF